MTNKIRAGWIFLVAVSFVAVTGCESTSDDHAIEDTEEALYGTPVIGAITPASGPVAGGTAITISGSSFSRDVSVTIGGAAVQVARESSRVLHVTTPAHAAGPVEVVVANGRRRRATATFTYEADATPPAPTSTGTTTPPPPPPPIDGGTTTPPTTTCTLQASGPVKATANGQVIENLRITAPNGVAGIDVEGFSNVVIRNVEILHSNAPGISFGDANGIHIENVSIVHQASPAAGPNPSDESNNIDGAGSTGVVIDHVRLEKGSSGVYLMDCPSPVVRFVEGHDFRGPFPRGQLVQFNRCSSATLEDFSAENPPATSWPEDNVSFFQSGNGTVRRGVLIGNNSPSGVGVMIESFDMVGTGALVEDVDAVDMGNGSFSAYPSKDVTFRRVRSRDGHCGSQQGRGAPLSNALIFAGSPESSNLRLEQASYANHCNENIVWDESTFTVVDVVEQDFTARPPLRLSFCWQ